MYAYTRQYAVGTAGMCVGARTSTAAVQALRRASLRVRNRQNGRREDDTLLSGWSGGERVHQLSCVANYTIAAGELFESASGVSTADARRYTGVTVIGPAGARTCTACGALHGIYSVGNILLTG